MQTQRPSRNPKAKANLAIALVVMLLPLPYLPRVNALFALPDPVVNTNRAKVIDLAARNKLPAMYPDTRWSQDGGLMAYSPDWDDLARRAATYVDKILKSTKPANLPVEQPTKFEFVINLKTAKQIGLTIPPNVLARADRVIR